MAYDNQCAPDKSFATSHLNLPVSNTLDARCGLEKKSRRYKHRRKRFSTTSSLPDQRHGGRCRTEYQRAKTQDASICLVVKRDRTSKGAV